MLGEARAYQLLELREALGPTRQELAKRIGVGQWQVSKLERGDLDRARLGTRSRRRRSGRRVRCRRSATPGGVRLWVSPIAWCQFPRGSRRRRR
ncbi:helix-turn-helix transcriptional regulator [Microbacterium lacticum]|uniref:helix-turn-helix domain-containing protein n=1 Tax=Microbacterium lacticum TaxID=33885 RepID=UPI002430FD15|nr:helix-turn-helix transcriptional regulator [Microbacterium lacticum]